MRFEDLLGLGGWDAEPHGAAAALGVSERTFRRWRGRHAEDGTWDWSTGGSASRRRAARRRRSCSGCCALPRALRRVRDPALPRHAAPAARLHAGLHDDPLWLQKSGAVAAAPRRGAHRRKRPRRAMAGMMLHQDASTHGWLEGLPALDLVITLDDATSAIYSAVLVDQEGTASTFAAWRVIERHACSSSSTPIGAATTSTRRKRAGRSPRPS